MNALSKRLMLGGLLLAVGAGIFTTGPASAEQSASYQNSIAKPDLLVVLVYDQDCHVTCTKVRPMMQKLVESYGQKVKLAELNTATVPESSKIAETLGVKKFFTESTDQAPIVGIFNSQGKRVKELQGFKEKEVYQSAIEKALKK